LAVIQILVVAVYSYFASTKNTSTQRLCEFLSILEVTQKSPIKGIVNGLKQAITNCKEP
jgi:hypothetical protein